MYTCGPPRGRTCIPAAGHVRHQPLHARLGLAIAVAIPSTLLPLLLLPLPMMHAIRLPYSPAPRPSLQLAAARRGEREAREPLVQQALWRQGLHLQGWGASKGSRARVGYIVRRSRWVIGDRAVRDCAAAAARDVT